MLYNQVGLVSIIMPAYNCQDFIEESIDSVINQSYIDWELIIIDDCSEDDTVSIIQKKINVDNRIKLYRLETNSGAAIARNTAISYAKGEFIAFLDSDDIWFPNKLEKQLTFMRENGYSFTCSSYNKIDSSGNSLRQVIKTREISNYDQILKYSPGNSTVIYNSSRLGKFYIPDIRKRNDYVMWLSIIKTAKYLYGYNEVLSSHRVRENSLSFNKRNLVKYHWYVYKKIEKISTIYSIYLITHMFTKTVFRKGLMLLKKNRKENKT